jgi:HAD superfamily hydrolase (TIGR01509 family)
LVFNRESFALRYRHGVPSGNPTTDEPTLPVTDSSEHGVVFDNDGVLVDSEPLWIRARKSLVHEANGRWLPEADTAMMGISSDRWSVYMRDRLGVAMPPSKIRDEVIARMIQLYRTQVPLLPGARAAVETIARRWRLGVASGSDRILLETVLSSSGLADHFAVTVAGDEVAEGKPSPMIYLTACRRLRCSPDACVAIEDSASGIASALAADMKVIAVPRPGFEPPPAVLQRAVAVLPSLTELDPDLIAAVLSA